MRRLPLWLSFVWAFLFLCLEKALFPSFCLYPFSPFLASLFHQTSLIRSLWLSCLAGLILDLSSSQFPFGYMALITTLTSLLLYGQRRHFFEDKPLAFSLYSGLISSVSSFLLLLFQWGLGDKLPLSFSLWFSDLVIMPFFDALYALIWFTCPSLLYTLLTRRHYHEEDG